MGNFGSAELSDDHRVHPVVGACIDDADHLAASTKVDAPPEGYALPSFVRHYIQACRHFGSVAGLGDDHDTNSVNSHDWLRELCQYMAPTLHRLFTKRNQSRFTYRGLLFVVLHRDDVHLFRRHMKGLELIQFLRVADVVVPEVAIIQFLGVHFACMRMLPLLQSCRCGSMGLDAGNLRSSRHSSVLRLMISKVLRSYTPQDASILICEIGDGRLAVVDATMMLPLHTYGFSDKSGRWSPLPMRAEYLIGRDLGPLQTMPSMRVIDGGCESRAVSIGASPLQPPPDQNVRPDRRGSSSCVSSSSPNAPTTTYLQHVVAASASRSRHLTATPTLNALICLQVPKTVSMDDTLTVVGVASAQQTTPIVARYRQVPPTDALDGNAPVSSHMLDSVLPCLLPVLDDHLPEDMEAKEFVDLLHIAGVNVRLLGCLYHHLWSRDVTSRSKPQPLPSTAADMTPRQRVAMEMVARVAKRWWIRAMNKHDIAEGASPKRSTTDSTVDSASTAACEQRTVPDSETSTSSMESTTLDLLRGLSDADFYKKEITPLLLQMFCICGCARGRQSNETAPFHIPVPPFQEVAWGPFLDRFKELTGITIERGRIRAIAPVVRLARRNFSLGSSDELSVCNIARRRMDGIAGATLFAAASWWAKNPSRMTTIVEQLHQRVSAAVAAAAQQPSVAAMQAANEAVISTQVFLAELLFSQLRLVLFHIPSSQDVNGNPAAMKGRSGPGSSPAGDCNLYRTSGTPAEIRQRMTVASSLCLPYVSIMLSTMSESPHDRLHVAREIMPVIDFLLREASSVHTGLQLLERLLQMRLMMDPLQYHVAASRNVADELHKLSVEALILAKHHQEALSVAQRWCKLCPMLFGTRSRPHCRALKLLLSAMTMATSTGAVNFSRSQLTNVAKQHVHLCEKVYGARDSKTGSALSELGSLTWKANPALGLYYFRRSMDIFYDRLGAVSRPMCSALHNTGLAYARLNRFRLALEHIRKSKHMADQLQESSTARSCEISERTVLGLAALKIQRWFREGCYGQAASQTTKTDVTTVTRCSTLTWSDERDEIGSSVAE